MKSLQTQVRRPRQWRQTLRLDPILLPREKQAVQQLRKYYRKRWPGQEPSDDEDLFFYLGDSPKNRRTWSATSRRLPTFRVGRGKMWHCRTHRWLTGREKLATLGFPVSEPLGQSMGVPVLPVRCTKRAEQLAGNAMHFSNVGVMQLIALCCFRERQ